MVGEEKAHYRMSRIMIQLGRAITWDSLPYEPPKGLRVTEVIDEFRRARNELSNVIDAQPYERALIESLEEALIRRTKQ